MTRDAFEVIKNSKCYVYFYKLNNEKKKEFYRSIQRESYLKWSFFLKKKFILGISQANENSRTPFDPAFTAVSAQTAEAIGFSENKYIHRIDYYY